MKGIKRFSLFIMILLSLFAIFGCNTKENEINQANNNLIFMGESKHWLATYTVKNKEDNKFTRVLDISRKESNSDQGIIEYTLFKNGEKENGTGEAGSRIGDIGDASEAKILKSDKYVLEIRWKEGKETFPLDLK